MSKIKAFIKAHSKSIAATLASLVVTIAAKYGFDLDVNAVGAIIGILLIGGTTFAAPPNQ